MPLFNNLRVECNTAGSLWKSDLFQYMPERRIRVNPEGIPDLACWLIACSQEWEQILKRTHAGLDAKQRAALRGQKKYARQALAVIGTIIRRMAETVAAKDFEGACDMWRRGIEGPPTPEQSCMRMTLAAAAEQAGG